MPQKNFDVSRETTQNIMNNLRQNSKLKGKELGDLQTDTGNAASSSNCKWNGNNRNQQTMVEKDGAVMDLGMFKGTSNLGCNTIVVDRDQETGSAEHTNHCMDTDTVILSQAKENDAAFTTQVPNNPEAETINRMEKTVTRTQGPLLPQWTDEQLDELFVFD